MYLALLGLLFLLFGIFFKIIAKQTTSTGSREGIYDGWGIGLLVTGIVFFVFSLFFTAISVSTQLSQREEIKLLVETERIHANKADTLTTEFATYLAKVYPQHEKNVFESIGPDNVGIYLVKYPDLKSSETILALVAEINKLQTDRYNQQLQKAHVEKKMRFRCKNPWIWNQVIPKEGVDL